MPTVGLLGTRADPLVDSVLLFFIAAPFVMYSALRLARRGRHRAHRNLQVGLLLAMVVAVVVLELSIRSGRTAEAVSGSAFVDTRILAVVFIVHLAVAIPTLLSWIILELLSWPRFLRLLPGSFSPTHTRWGRVTFIGLCVTSATGTGLYVMGFAF